MNLSELTLPQICNMVNNKELNAYITSTISLNGHDVKIIVITDYKRCTEEFLKKLNSKVIDLGFNRLASSFLDRVPLTSNELKLQKLNISQTKSNTMECTGKNFYENIQYFLNTVIVVPSGREFEVLTENSKTELELKAETYLKTIIRNSIANNRKINPIQVPITEVNIAYENKKVGNYSVHEKEVKSKVNGKTVRSIVCALIDNNTGYHYYSHVISE